MSLLRIGWPVGQRLSKNNLARMQDFLRPQTVTLQVLSAISSKANMIGYKRPKPFPYEEKKFTMWHHYYDKTTHRFDDNSKVIIVDGPIAAGKSTFAKQLAEDLDMKHYPEANMDHDFINVYGYDRREINKHVSRGVQVLDVKDFYRDPHHINVPFMQMQMLSIRFEQYCEALAHILNTGQGVVLERSVYSDFVFMEAMFQAGYVSPLLKKVYNDFSKNLKYFLMQPHLVVYLDVPVDIVKKRIKERNNEWEINTKVLTDKYLTCIENQYKTNFLRSICAHAEVMVYDWSNFGDAEVVVEDIERIDFDRIQLMEKKFGDWVMDLERDWAEKRVRYSDNSLDIIEKCLPNHFISEMFLYDDEVDEFLAALEKIPGEKYAPGYNPSQGDSVWLKT